MPAGRGWQAVAWSCGVAILVAGWVVLRWPTPLWMLTDMDGAHQLGGASQILRGEHPFVDWHTDYGPLRYYPSAAAQWLLGRRTLSELVLATGGYAIAYAILFHLCWQASRRRAIAVAVLALALLLIPWMSKYYMVLGPAVCLWAAWRYVAHPSRRARALLAAAVVVMGLSRADFGAYTAVAALVAIMTQPGSTRARAAELGRFVALGLLFVSPWLGWLAVRGAVGRYLADTFVTAPAHAAAMSLPFPRVEQTLPFHAPENAVFLLFVGFYATPAVALAVALAPGGCADTSERRQIVTAAVLAQALLVHCLHRSHYQHLLEAAPMSLVLFAWLTGRALFAHARHATRGAIAVMLAVTAWAAVRVAGWPQVDVREAVATARLHAMPLDDMLAGLSAANPGHPWLEAIGYVRRCTAPGDRVVALPPLVGVYYFADRAFAGGQPAWSPGFFSADADQRRWIERVRAWSSAT